MRSQCLFNPLPACLIAVIFTYQLMPLEYIYTFFFLHLYTPYCINPLSDGQKSNEKKCNATEECAKRNIIYQVIRYVLAGVLESARVHMIEIALASFSSLPFVPVTDDASCFRLVKVAPLSIRKGIPCGMLSYGGRKQERRCTMACFPEVPHDLYIL